MELRRRVLYVIAFGFLILAGTSMYNLIRTPEAEAVHATVTLLHDADLLTVGPVSRAERSEYISSLKQWATERGLGQVKVAPQDSDIVVRGQLFKEVNGARVIDLDLTSIPDIDRVQLAVSPLDKVSTTAPKVRSLVETIYESSGAQFRATVIIPREPLYILPFVCIGLLALGWLFSVTVSTVGRPTQWSESRFTLYTCIAYLPAVGWLLAFIPGGYLTYLAELMSPLAAYILTMATMAALLMLPVIPLWRARYGGSDNRTIFPGWTVLLTLPPFLASTAHLAIALWMPMDLSVFWWIPIDGMLQVLCLVVSVALAPLLLSAKEWTSAPVGLYRRAWVVPSGKDGWANAFVMGMNPKRTNLFVTERLLQELTSEQLTSVLAHEQGHIALGHVWRLPVLSVAMNLSVESLLLAIPSWTNNTVLSNYIAFSAPIVYFGTVPILMAVSRRFERAADSWACLQLKDRAVALAEALCKIQQINGSQQSRWLRWWASHPSVEERIAKIGAYIAEPVAKTR